MQSDDREFYDNAGSVYVEDPATNLAVNFTVLLAIFYPACTGIMVSTFNNIERSLMNLRLEAIEVEFWHLPEILYRLALFLR